MRQKIWDLSLIVRKICNYDNIYRRQGPAMFLGKNERTGAVILPGSTIKVEELD